MALPGGRSGPADADARSTAERETWEEVGIDLRRSGTLLGRLDDVEPRSGAPRIVVSAFVFAVPAGTEPEWNHEVDLAVWVPVDQLTAPGAATEYLHLHPDGTELRFPAIGIQGHLIWGITYRILTQFLELAAER
jgi:8-oxo-dGTP pyrophosphatase MutT (NUDIX family)